MTKSVLDDLGEEITGIAFPVAACMALTVLLVKVLNPTGDTSANTVYIASIAYSEQSGDSAGAKLGGALLNAIIFIAVIAGMTFVLFLLFKYRCYRVIYGYMAFALFNIFFFLTGAIAIQLLQVAGVHMDAFSLCFLLFNFSVVGILGMFFMPVPLLLKQCYTVWVGIITAYLFTYIPEWTSWVLLVLMAVYDLVAVLMPGGPLKILVDMAVERQQELPALIYEARPVGRPYQRGHWGRRAAAAAGTAQAGSPSQSMALLDEAERGPAALGSPSTQQQQQQRRMRPGAVPVAEGLELSSASPPPSPHRPLLQRVASTPSSPSASASPAATDGAAADGTSSMAGAAAGATAGAAAGPRTRLRNGARPIGEAHETHGSSSHEGTIAGGSAAHHAGAASTAAAAEEAEEAGASSAAAAAAGLLDAVLPPALAPIRTASGALDGEHGVVLSCRGSRQRMARCVGVAVWVQGSGVSDDDGKGSSGPAGAVLPPALVLVCVALVAVDGNHAMVLLRRGLGQHVASAPGESPTHQHTFGQQGEAAIAVQEQEGEEEDDEAGLPDAIKLGLGDFIFYSMLVGRAAMYDMMTVYASFLAIISGLGITLLLLALMQKALPALPVSIALGVVFYFLTRLTLEPFLVPLAANLAYY